MKNNECKVIYTDESQIEADFRVECAEIIMKYKIYGRSKKGWELLAIKNDKQKAKDFASNIDKKIYDGKMIIEHNEKTNTDFPIEL